jgi:hypothetical protein
MLLVLPAPTTAAIRCRHPAARARQALVNTAFSIIDACAACTAEGAASLPGTDDAEGPAPSTWALCKGSQQQM